MAGKVFWGSNRIKKFYWGTTRIKKIYWGTQLVFSDAHIVTYYSDSGAFQTKEIDDGADCIRNAPTVSKSGYTFVGWRSDRAASATVLPSKTCNADGIVLYAVFKRALTVTAVGGSSNVTNSGIQFYNTGNVANPSIKLSSNSSLSGWNLVGYRTNTTASTSVSYVANGTYTFSASTTIYAVFSRTLTASFSGNGATGGSTASKTGTQVYNNGNYSNPAITLPASGYTKANTISGRTEYSWWFASWGLNGAAYGVGASYTMTSSVTFSVNWGSTPISTILIGSRDNLVEMGHYMNNPVLLMDNHRNYPECENKTIHIQIQIVTGDPSDTGKIPSVEFQQDSNLWFQDPWSGAEWFDMLNHWCPPLNIVSEATATLRGDLWWNTGPDSSIQLKFGNIITHIQYDRPWSYKVAAWVDLT